MSYVLYCKKCLYPSNHGLTLSFDEEGICSGCRIHQEKYFLDWHQKFRELQKLVLDYKKSGNYDCIVPVSGGKDSFFVVHIVRHVLKLNPLLVSYNRHYNTAIGIKNLEILRTMTGCDIITMTPKPELTRKLLQSSLRMFASMHWPFIAGDTVFPVQMAVRLKIPLIIWGAHQGIDQCGMFSHRDNVEMSRRYRREHDLLGKEPEELVDKDENYSEEALSPLFYPKDSEIERVGVRGIYLNNYIRWDSKAQHEKMLKIYRYFTMPQQRTFDTYNDVNCAHYSGVHDYIKFCKLGYGKATDHACREIRLGRLSREQGIFLINQYQNRSPNDLETFLSWINWSKKEFQACIDQHRDLKAWNKETNGLWKQKTPLVTEYNNSIDTENEIFNFNSYRITAPTANHTLTYPYPLLMQGGMSGTSEEVDGHESSWSLDDGWL